MMKSEFIERTGFEPTADEYREIEEEYYGFDGDKDQYCKQWLKNGGVNRLARRRTARIEELEQKLAATENNAREQENRLNGIICRKVNEIGELRAAYESASKALEEKTAQYNSLKDDVEVAKRGIEVMCRLFGMEAKI